MEQKIIQTKYTELKEYVFVGLDNKKPIHNESCNAALRRLGFNDKGQKIRLHGFRGIFSSLMETLDVDNNFSNLSNSLL